MKRFSRKEAERITGIPARRIQFYTDSDLISMNDKNPGRGRERLYSKENLIEVLFIKELSLYHTGIPIIKTMMNELRENIGNFFHPDYHRTDQYSPNWFLVIDHKGMRNVNLHIHPKDKIIKINMEGYNSALIINVGVLAGKIEKL